MTMNADQSAISTTKKPKAPAEAPLDAKHERVDSIDTRAHEIMQQILAEGPGDDDDAEPAAAETAPSDEAAAPAKDRAADGKFKAKDAAAKEPAADAAKDPEAERAERIARAGELERQNRAKHSKLVERENRIADRERTYDAREREIAAREARIVEREKAFDDPALLMPLLAEKVPGEKLASYLLEAQRPEKVAEWAARRTAQEAAKKSDPEKEEMRARLAALEGHIQQTSAASSRANAEQQFATVVEQLAADAPHAAAMLKSKRDRLIAAGHQVAPYLAQHPEVADAIPGSTLMEKVVHFIESDLTDYASVFAPQSSQGAEPSHPSTPQSPSTKARTLSSRTTAGRSELLDEDASKLSLDERAELLKRLARKSG